MQFKTLLISFANSNQQTMVIGAAGENGVFVVKTATKDTESETGSAPTNLKLGRQSKSLVRDIATRNSPAMLTNLAQVSSH